MVNCMIFVVHHKLRIFSFIKIDLKNFQHKQKIQGEEESFWS